jgi:tape measure domain-containing protein
VAKGDLQFQVGLDVDLDEIKRLERALATGGSEAAKQFNAALGGTVTKQIVFETRTDASGAKRLVAVEKERLSVADAYINKLNQIDRIQAGSATSLRQQVNQAKQARDEIARYESGVNSVGLRVRKVNDSWAAQNTKVVELERSLARATASGFWDRVKADLGVGGIVNFANGLTQITNGLQSASIVAGQVIGTFNTLLDSLNKLQQFKLTFVASGAGEAGGLQALNESSRIALNLGVNLNSVRQSFQQLTPVIRNSGGTIGDVSRITEALSSRFAAYGIAGDRARRVTNGVIQAFAKGRLQAEELTQQISEADPAFKTDFARAVGISVAELEEWVKAGRVTGDVLLENLPKLNKSSIVYGKLGVSAKDAAASLLTSGTTVDQVTNKLQGLTQLSLERLAKAFEPFLVSLVQVGAAVVDVVTDISKLEVIKSIGELFGVLGGQFAAIVDTALRLGQTILSVADAANSLLKPLLSLPGVAQAFGLVVFSKLIGPLDKFKKSLLSNIDTASTFGRVLNAATTGQGLQRGLTALVLGTSAAEDQIEKLANRSLSLASASTQLKGRITGVNTEIAKYENLAQKAKSSAVIVGSGAANRAAGVYEAKLKELRKEVGRYERSLGRVDRKQSETNTGLTALRATSGRGAAAINGLKGAFLGVGQSVKGLFSLLGPIGTALLAISTITSAYADANKQSNAIAEESKSRIEALSLAQKELTGVSERSEKSITGLALVFSKFSLVVDAAVTPVVNFFNSLSGSSKESKKAVEGPLAKTIDLLGKLALAAAGGALAGASIGAAFAGIGAGPGAIIGGITAALIAFIASGDDAKVKLAQLTKELKAQGEAAKAESRAIVRYVEELNKLAVANEKATAAEKKGKGQGPTASDIAKVAAGYARAVDAAQQLVAIEEKLKAEKAGAEAEKRQFGPGIEAQARLAQVKTSIDLITQSLAALDQQEAKDRTPEQLAERARLERELSKLTEERANLEKQLKGTKPVSPEQIQEYQEVQARLAAINAELGRVSPAVQAARDRIDEFAKKFGFLSLEQLKTARTTETIEEELKGLQAALAKTDPLLQPSKWVELNSALAFTSLELSKIKDEAEGLQALFTGRLITLNIETGQLPESIKNAERLVSSLETATANIDIKAPTLPGVIRELVEAQQFVDGLNGRRATIFIDVIEKSIRDGAAVTLSSLDRYLAALQQKSITIPIDSPGIDSVLQQIDKVQKFRDLGSKTSFALRKQLLENQAASQQEKESLKQAGEARTNELAKGNADRRKKEIEDIAKKESAYYDKKIAKIREEIDLIRAAADERIRGLQAATPAERELQALREQELRKVAEGKGSEREKLEARAQLERIEREKQIQKIQAETAQQQEQLTKDLEAQNKRKLAQEEEAKKKIEKISEEESNREEKVSAARSDASQKDLDNRKKAFQISEEERKLVNDIIKTILNSREKGGDAGSIAEGLVGDIETIQKGVDGFIEIAKEAEVAATKAKETSDAMKSTGEGAVVAAGIINKEMLPGLESSFNQVDGIDKKLRGLDGLTVKVNIVTTGTGTPGLWTGGPTQAGQTYQVNELGREGFLSASGTLSPINKPKNALWRAPSSGTVIPAHIMSGLNVPVGGVRTNAKPMTMNSGSSGLQRVVRAIQASLAVPRESGQAMHELTAVQARQAIEIGKLSRAVNRLADKDHSVNVSVRNTGSTAFIDALSRNL